MEMNEKKKKILEYLFSCLSILIGDNEMSIRKYSFLFIHLKSKKFHCPQNWEEFERIKLDLINFLLKLSKHSYIFTHLFKNRGLIIIFL